MVVAKLVISALSVELDTELAPWLLADDVHTSSHVLNLIDRIAVSGRRPCLIFVVLSAKHRNQAFC